MYFHVLNNLYTMFLFVVIIIIVAIIIIIIIIIIASEASPWPVQWPNICYIYIYISGRMSCPKCYKCST